MRPSCWRCRPRPHGRNPVTRLPRNPTPSVGPAQQVEDDPDLDVNFAQPDFTIAALPTTLRVPRHKGSFRVTHRFTRTLGQGDSAICRYLFGLDGGALIGLEYRFGLFRGTQVGFYRTSNAKTINFFVQREIKAQSGSFPFTLDVIANAEGTNNFRDSYSPSIGVILSRTVGDRCGVLPRTVLGQQLQPAAGRAQRGDNNTVMIGIGARAAHPADDLSRRRGHAAGQRVRPNVTQISFGIERRAGGHMFQLNFSNGVGTTFAQIARGGTGRKDWYLGFNISRKFF